jgi:hypothetical protein
MFHVTLFVSLKHSSPSVKRNITEISSKCGSLRVSKGLIGTLGVKPLLTRQASALRPKLFEFETDPLRSIAWFLDTAVPKP